VDTDHQVLEELEDSVLDERVQVLEDGLIVLEEGHLVLENVLIVQAEDHLALEDVH